MRPKQTETKVPSEEMRKRAREWLYNADHPNECASQGEVDDLATLLDEVRTDALSDAAAVLIEEQSRGGRVMDFDNAVNAPAMAARIRALGLR